jgi:hypothetical protein
MDNVAKGWPGCLRALAAAVCLLISEAQNFVFGWPFTIYTSHDLGGFLTAKRGIWLSDIRLLKYQAQLLECPDLSLQVCSALNPASLLPTEGDPLTHSFEEVLQESQAELWDTEVVYQKAMFYCASTDPADLCPKAEPREQRGLTLYILASRLQKQKARSNPYMVIYNFIGFFTLVLHDFSPPSAT